MVDGASCGDGYVQLRILGRRVVAHRAAYQVAHGPIPFGFAVTHTCANRRCVLPAHLRAVTQAEAVASRRWTEERLGRPRPASEARRAAKRRWAARQAVAS